MLHHEEVSQGRDTSVRPRRDTIVSAPSGQIFNYILYERTSPSIIVHNLTRNRDSFRIHVRIEAECTYCVLIHKHGNRARESDNGGPRNVQSCTCIGCNSSRIVNMDVGGIACALISRLCYVLFLRWADERISQLITVTVPRSHQKYQYNVANVLTIPDTKARMLRQFDTNFIFVEDYSNKRKIHWLV